MIYEWAEHKLGFRPEKLLVMQETREDKDFGDRLAHSNISAATVREYLYRIKTANEEFGS